MRIVYFVLMLLCLTTSVFAETYIPVYNDGAMYISAEVSSLKMDENTLQMEVHGLIEFTPEGKIYEEYRTGLTGVNTEKFTYLCDVLHSRGRFMNISFYNAKEDVLAVDRNGTPWQENDALYLQLVEASRKYEEEVKARKEELKEEALKREAMKSEK